MPTPDLPQRCWGYLGNMYVAAPYRGHGLGTRLLDTVIAAADERSYRRLVLTPSPRSIPFYRRAGFVDAGPQEDGVHVLVRRQRSQNRTVGGEFTVSTGPGSGWPYRPSLWPRTGRARSSHGMVLTASWLDLATFGHGYM